MSDFPREIMNRCLKNDAYLKTLQKALVFDEQDGRIELRRSTAQSRPHLDSFENTYNDMLEELIKENWAIHRIAEKISIDDFRRNLGQ